MRELWRIRYLTICNRPSVSVRIVGPCSEAILHKFFVGCEKKGSKESTIKLLQQYVESTKGRFAIAPPCPSHEDSKEVKTR